MYALLMAVVAEVASSAPARYLWKSSPIQWAYGMASCTYGVFLQKLHMTHLDEVDFVGGPAKGLTAIVTGPTSGIGMETAAALARRGATVILACRSVARGEELKSRIEGQMARLGHDAPRLEVWRLDLTSLASVREFCARWDAQTRPLNILVNNAGIYSMNAPREETADGFEAHMGCNHLGHYLLTLSMLPSLRLGAEHAGGSHARVVCVASDVHMMATRGLRMSDPHFRLPKSYVSLAAYAQSKLANILFTRELRRRLGPGSKIEAYAVHPGMVMTNVVRTLPAFIKSAYQLLLGFVLLTPSQGARASIYAATAPGARVEATSTNGYFDANARPTHTSPSGDDTAQAAWLWRWSAEQVMLPPGLKLVMEQ
ncbi:hypothetical protein FOA52_003858 [Chlamydomonas sp. UWO 241]|nr:hypothetical protein FOA52_003858 [Chlamydomonas sp. UWO 241]